MLQVIEMKITFLLLLEPQVSSRILGKAEFLLDYAQR